MKEIEVKIQIRNNLVKQRRLEMGLSQKELAKAIGISQTAISGVETFKVTGIYNDPHGAFTKLAEFFGCNREDLSVPFFEKIQNAQEVFLCNYENFQHRLEASIDSPSLIEDKKIRDIYLKPYIKEALSKLTPREEAVIKLKFGFEDTEGIGECTLEEIGNELGVSPERVRQILEHALYKIRKTDIHKKLMEL